jgi:hypothetical protein
MLCCFEEKFDYFYIKGKNHIQLYEEKGTDEDKNSSNNNMVAQLDRNIHSNVQKKLQRFNYMCGNIYTAP